ncbi:MAG: hypothetical protein A2284_12650 [Deltaproteobacteria bacterium RIFOXYA12_FULL_61_11]|nr:MAG: hypothetical protein A2284_12650 [Deltaproteobacteria bacterium RIFOXYA12_FULL_61_11]
MLNIYEYEDYRRFIAEYYQAQKNKNRSFSYRFLAKKAGIASENYFKLVIDGKRNLTHKNVRKFAKAMNLSEKESIFFENMVFFNQAKSEEERAFYLRNMNLSKNYNYGTLLSKDQYEVLSKWYYVTIRELTYLKDFKDDPKWIANKLDREISSTQVREAIDLLLRTGLLNRDRERLIPTVPDFVTEEQAVSDAIVQYHLEMIEKAKRSIKTQTREVRCLNGLTVAVNKEDVPKIKEKITEFRDTINKFLTRQKSFDAVYQLNLHFFKLTSDI